MDPFSYFVAFSRLAPVQASFFGHPTTSGEGEKRSRGEEEKWRRGVGEKRSRGEEE
jgi:hypothetical protein